MQRICHMCDREYTSDEHSPPKCLFPESRDTEDGVDHRRNLITVPSCDAHNSGKSQDDEYLLHVLAASYTSSPIGLNQFITKVRRAFERSPSKAKAFALQSAPVMLRREEQPEWEEGLQVLVRGDRLDSVLSNCARALYFHETGLQMLVPAQVITAFTMYNDPLFQAQVDKAIQATDSYFAKAHPKGENQGVFWYKFEEGAKTAIFLLCFYGQSKAMVRFTKTNPVAQTPRTEA